LVEQYAELKVQTGTVTPAYAETLLDAGRLCGAIRRGMALLQYGDQSARRLAYKLTAKGVDRDIAARAVNIPLALSESFEQDFISRIDF
jgi:hypothetical protein